MCRAAAITRFETTHISKITEEEPIPAAARGDPDEEKTDLIISLIPAARRYARSLARRTGDDPDDLLQTALEILWRRLRERSGSEIMVGRYLFACIRNLHHNMLRQHHRHQRRSLDIPQIAEGLALSDTESSYGDLLDRVHALAALAARDRDLLLLHAAGFTSAELGLIYGRGQSAMKMRLKRAGDRLHRSLHEQSPPARYSDIRTAGDILARARHLIRWADGQLLQSSCRT